MSKVDDWIQRVLNRPWWTDAAVMVVLALGAVAAAWTFSPAANETLDWLGFPFSGGCAFRDWTGQPCPQCGMTRAWVHAVRGNFGAAFAYNPAGATLLAAIVYGGIIGVIRLVRRSPRALALPDAVLFTLVGAWAGVLWIGGWLGRIFLNYNPLP